MYLLVFCALLSTLTCLEGSTITSRIQTNASSPLMSSSTSSHSEVLPNGGQREFDTTTIVVIATVGGGGVLLIIIAFIVVVIRLTRRNGDDPLFTNAEQQPDKEPSTRSNSITPVEEPVEDPVEDPPEEPVELGKISAGKPTRIRASDLAEYVTRKMENERFSQEFKQLPADNMSACTVGMLPENFRNKNRFVNILPYDDTRVKLPVSDDAAEDDDDDDYINANYIVKYGGYIRDEAAYIATQGPKDKTIADFWKMVWYERVNRILMITMLVECGKKKCEMYWPENVDAPADYGDINVSLTEVEQFGDYVQRTMKMRHSNGAERKVTHFHFLLWRDKGVPDDIYPLLAFRRKVRSLDAVASGPLVIHCSAGVGRSGTFIALDTLLDEAKQCGEVDVLDVVTHLRRQRMMLVQTQEQYTYIYECLVDALTTGETATERSAVRNSYAAMTTEISRQFQVLQELKSKNCVGRDVEGLQAVNVSKNRRLDVVPGDNVRVHLSYPSIYINAAIVSGFHTPLSYILTQLPLAETVEHFWRMVVENRCHTIVLLDAVGSDETTVKFWTSTVNESTSYGSTDVTLLRSRSTNSVVIHSLQLTTDRSDSPVSVDVMELTTWPSASETPSDCDSLLQLIHLVAQRQRQHRSTPVAEASRNRPSSVVVQCLDGASRSGLYTAASYIVDKMQHDDEVDVLLSCRYVITARPTAITSQEQYDYLYRLAVRSTEWTPAPATEHDGDDDVGGRTENTGGNDDTETSVGHASQLYVADEEESAVEVADEESAISHSCIAHI